MASPRQSDLYLCSSAYFVGLLLPVRRRSFSLEKGIDTLNFLCDLLKIVGITPKSRGGRRGIVLPEKFYGLNPSIISGGPTRRLARLRVPDSAHHVSSRSSICSK